MTAVVLCLSLAASGGVVSTGGRKVVDLMVEEEPLSCLEGRVRCKKDATCRVLLEAISKVCGQSSKEDNLSVKQTIDFVGFLTIFKE